MPRARSKIPSGYPISRITTPSGETRFHAIVTWSSGGRKQQVRRRFQDLDQAIEFVDQARIKIRNGDYRAADTTTLEQLVTAWVHQLDGVRPITRDGYLQVLKPLVRDHGQVRVQRIDQAMIDSWRKDWPTSGGTLRKGLSKRSIVMTLNALRMVLDYAIRTGLLTTNPAQGIRPPRESLADKRRAEQRKVTAQVWTFDQMLTFIRYADSDPLAAAWRLSCAGLRRSEVLGVDWSSINLDAGTVEVRQGRTRQDVDDVKAERSRRTMPVEQMLPGTVARLRELWMAQGRPERGLVIKDVAGRPFDGDLYSRAFTRLSHEAGLPRIKLHALRHTIASRLEQLGVPAATRAALLGHTIQVHLDVYTVSTEDQLAAAAEAFGSAFSGLAVVDG